MAGRDRRQRRAARARQHQPGVQRLFYRPRERAGGAAPPHRAVRRRARRGGHRGAQDGLCAPLSRARLLELDQRAQPDPGAVRQRAVAPRAVADRPWKSRAARRSAVVRLLLPVSVTRREPDADLAGLAVARARHRFSRHADAARLVRGQGRRPRRAAAARPRRLPVRAGSGATSTPSAPSRSGAGCSPATSRRSWCWPQAPTSRS